MNIMELTPIEHLIKRIDHLINIDNISDERHNALTEVRYLATELLGDEALIIEQLNNKNSEKNKRKISVLGKVYKREVLKFVRELEME